MASFSPSVCVHFSIGAARKSRIARMQKTQGLLNRAGPAFNAAAMERNGDVEVQS